MAFSVITLASADEMRRQLDAVAMAPKVRKELVPLIIENLAGQSWDGVGIADGVALAIVQYRGRVSTELKAALVELMPRIIVGLVANEQVRKEALARHEQLTDFHPRPQK